jgi:hypothetical protein
MQAPPVVVNMGFPALDFETWEINELATSFTGIITLLPVSGSETGTTVE